MAAQFFHFPWLIANLGIMECFNVLLFYGIADTLYYILLLIAIVLGIQPIATYYEVLICS